MYQKYIFMSPSGPRFLKEYGEKKNPLFFIQWICFKNHVFVAKWETKSRTALYFLELNIVILFTRFDQIEYKWINILF